MILSDRDILTHLKKKKITIDPFNKESLQPAGYDLRFSGECILNEDTWRGEKLEIPPKTHAILSTLERVGMKNLMGDLKLRSSFCREGLIGSFGWVDPGWIGVLSLSVFNASEHPVEIEKGERLAQISFVALSSATEEEYTGKYKGSTRSEGSKR